MNHKTVKKKLVLKKTIKSFLYRTLLTIVIVLIGLIYVKKDPGIKELIHKNIYERSLKFTQVKQLYQKYFGSILPTEKIFQENQPVFNEKLTYSKINTYKDGAMLSVESNYMVPNLESGVVIFVGEKDDYGSTIIIEQIDGVEVSYSNLTISGINIYDYVEKGQLLGEAKNQKLFLIFYKDGKYLNYKDYI